MASAIPFFAFGIQFKVHGPILPDCIVPGWHALRAGAVEGYRDFLALRPNEIAAHSNLGVLLSRLSRYDEAIAEYKKALHLDPENAGVLLNLGLAYYKSGRISEAAPEFSKARDLSPGNLQATLLLAECRL